MHLVRHRHVCACEHRIFQYEADCSDATVLMTMLLVDDDDDDDDDDDLEEREPDNPHGNKEERTRIAIVIKVIFATVSQITCSHRVMTTAATECMTAAARICRLSSSSDCHHDEVSIDSGVYLQKFSANRHRLAACHSCGC